MFERIVELVSDAWEYLAPFKVVPAYEKSVVLRFGLLNRVLDPGFHWKWPLVETLHDITTAVTTLRLPPQTLTTKDDHTIVLAAIVKYQVRDPAPYVTDIWDQTDVLGDTTMGAVRLAVADATWEQLRAAPPEQRVLSEVRKQANRYGFRIEAVTFVDIGRVRTLRLIGDSAPLNLEN